VSPRPRRLALWIGAALLAVLALAVAVPYAYIHLVEGDAPPALSAVPAADVEPATGTVDGRWTVAAGSQAGYRVAEVLGGQDTTAVGRTEAVAGGLTVEGGAVTAGSFTVDLTRVTSDQSRRDDQFRTRIMDTATYPQARFTLTRPLELGQLADAAGTRQVQAPGTLELHGAEKAATADLTVTRTGSTVQVSGQVPVVFADYGIDNPSFGSFVKTGDSGTIEVLLTLEKA